MPAGTCGPATDGTAVVRSCLPLTPLTPASSLAAPPPPLLLPPAPSLPSAQESAIQEFIIGAVSAYKSGYSLAALALELKQNEVRTGDAALDASLRLSDREEATRRVWLLLIYLTLAAKAFEPSAGVDPASLLSGAETAAVGLEVLTDAGDGGGGEGGDPAAAAAPRSPPPDGAEAVDRFRGLVADVTGAAAKGYTLDSLKLEQSLALRDGEQGLSAAEASVRSQFMRIIFLTARMVTPKTQGA